MPILLSLLYTIKYLLKLRFTKKCFSNVLIDGTFSSRIFNYKMIIKYTKDEYEIDRKNHCFHKTTKLIKKNFVCYFYKS